MADNIEKPLESWKGIASYLGRDVRTAIRWEKKEGLPVHRHRHKSRSSVYAYPSELDAWRTHREPPAEPMPSSWLRPVPALASTVALAVVVLTAGSGPPISAVAQAADGIVTRQVWTGQESYHESISPDGRYLAFADYWTRDGDLAVRDLETQTVQHLTDGADSGYGEAGSIVFSPDGSRIAYGWYSSNFLDQLRVVERDGSSEHVLIQGDERHSIRVQDWSPDGSSLLATRVVANPPRLEDSDSRIVSISTEDGSLRVLKNLGQDRPTDMAYSPDGRYIAYSRSSGDIFLLAADASGESVLVAHPAVDYVVEWAPDGKSLFFASNRTGDWGLWRLPIEDGKASGPAELVKHHTGRLSGIGSTADGTIYYRLAGRNRDVYGAEIDPVTSKVVGTPELVISKFIGSNTNPVWSPDGTQLAYYSLRGQITGEAALCIRDVRTGEERELNPKVTWSFGLSWFPDGRSLLVSGSESTTQPLAYFRIDARTGNASKLFDIDFQGLVPWAVLSPDRRRLYNLGPHGLVEHDLVSGAERRIATSPEGTGFVELAISPDGELLATQLNWRGKRPNALAVVRVDSGEIREVVSASPGQWFQNLAWTPDGRHLLFTKNYSEGSAESTRVDLWRADVESGEEEELGLSFPGISDLAVHPDGNRIAFTYMRYLSEIWAMENFLPLPEDE